MDKSFETPAELFIRVLQVPPELAATLVANGFTSLEEIAYVPVNEFSSLADLHEPQIRALRMRARRYLMPDFDDRGDADPQDFFAGKPLHPMPGGSSASREDDDT